MHRAHQPRTFSFPDDPSAVKGRSFSVTLFYTSPWLHYRAVSPLGYMVLLSRANEGKLLASGLSASVKKPTFPKVLRMERSLRLFLSMLLNLEAK